MNLFFRIISNEEQDSYKLWHERASLNIIRFLSYYGCNVAQTTSGVKVVAWLLRLIATKTHTPAVGISEAGANVVEFTTTLVIPGPLAS